MVFLLDHGGAGGTGEAVGSVAVVGDLVGVHRVVALDQGQGAVLVLVDPVAQSHGLELCCIQIHTFAGDGKEAVIGFDVGFGHVYRPNLAFAGVGVQGDGLAHIQHTLAAAAEHGAAGNGHRALSGINRIRAAGDGGVAGDLQGGGITHIANAGLAGDRAASNGYGAIIRNHMAKRRSIDDGAAGHIQCADYLTNIIRSDYHLAAFQIHRTDNGGAAIRLKPASSHAVLEGQRGITVHFNRLRRVCH